MMDEAYKAAAKAIHNARPESEDKYSHKLCDKYARAAVEAFLEASGIDPDKTYYTVDYTVASPDDCEAVDYLRMDGVLVEVERDNDE